MTSALISNWGVIGSYAFLLACIAGSFLGGYLAWKGFFAKLRYGTIEVRFLGQTDETVTRDDNPFKFWFVMGQLLLTLSFCIFITAYFTYVLLADAMGRL